MNVDLKIISKALAHRLEKAIPYIIHSDQTSFIEGRKASCNTHRLFGLFHYSSLQQEDPITATLDAEKASV